MALLDDAVNRLQVTLSRRLVVDATADLEAGSEQCGGGKGHDGLAEPAGPRSSQVEICGFATYQLRPVNAGEGINASFFARGCPAVLLKLPYTNPSPTFAIALRRTITAERQNGAVLLLKVNVLPTAQTDGHVSGASRTACVIELPPVAFPQRAPQPVDFTDGLERKPAFSSRWRAPRSIAGGLRGVWVRAIWRGRRFVPAGGHPRRSQPRSGPTCGDGPFGGTDCGAGFPRRRNLCRQRRPSEPSPTHFVHRLPDGEVVASLESKISKRPSFSLSAREDSVVRGANSRRFALTRPAKSSTCSTVSREQRVLDLPSLAAAARSAAHRAIEAVRGRGRRHLRTPA
jgi:hypothetical protein